MCTVMLHQWFKNFHDTTGAMEGYDAIERRSKGRGGAKYGGGGGARYVPCGGLCSVLRAGFGVRMVLTFRKIKLGSTAGTSCITSYVAIASDPSPPRLSLVRCSGWPGF